VALAPSRAAQQPAPPAKTEKNGKAGKATMVRKIYQVIDLVTPIPSGPQTEQAENGSSSACASHGSYSPVAAYLKTRSKQGKDAVCSPANAGSLEHELIELIKTTISPTIWTDAGGPASLEYFPLTHSLVAHAPPDVQEQIAELFEAMR